MAYLSTPAAYGRSATTPVDRRETHIAHVFLVGDEAYKLKKSVKLSFLDFSTLALRRAACDAELRLNRRTAPDIYLGLVPVTRRPDGGFVLDGAGATVDWLVHMRRFADDALLDAVARAGRFDLDLARRLADEIAAFHAAAEVVNDGGADEMRWVATMNAEAIAAHAPQVFDADAVVTLNAAVLAAVDACGDLLDRRRADGFVRHCHGDLHLRNIFLDDGTPRLFDAIEFDDRLARIDVLYDLAFLLMDLWHRDLHAAANRVLGRYLLRTGDFAGLRALPLFMSLRAGIRAHVSATTAQNGADREPLRQEARQYLALAADLLRPRPPVLVGVGGVSGSGKSTFAAALAPDLGMPPGAVCLRSDEIRKRLMGVEPEQRLGADAYAGAVSARVYAELRRCAGQVIGAGMTAIADAVHNDAPSRAALADVAAQAGVRFAGFWLEAPVEVLEHRLDRRSGDASDADSAVMRAQLNRDPGAITWHRLAAGRPLDDLVDEAHAELAADGHVT